jgi:desulfoferrodoxin (superoxide reductase-like protein)
VLAEKLHMTVGELQVRMSNREFIEWQVLFARRGQRAELEAKRQGR